MNKTISTADRRRTNKTFNYAVLNHRIYEIPCIVPLFEPAFQAYNRRVGYEF